MNPGDGALGTSSTATSVDSLGLGAMKLIPAIHQESVGRMDIATVLKVNTTTTYALS